MPTFDDPGKKPFENSIGKGENVAFPTLFSLTLSKKCCTFWTTLKEGIGVTVWKLQDLTLYSYLVPDWKLCHQVVKGKHPIAL